MDIGDRVRVVRDCEDGGDHWAIGKTGVVTDDYDDFAEVRLDDDTGSPYASEANPKGTYLFGVYQLEETKP